MNSRLSYFRSEHRIDVLVKEMFESAIENLNEGWRLGKRPEILYDYIKIIRDSADHPAISKRARLRGLSAVAMVTYALGDLMNGNKMGESNWEDAQRLESNDESELKCWQHKCLHNI